MLCQLELHPARILPASELAVQISQALTHVQLRQVGAGIGRGASCAMGHCVSGSGDICRYTGECAGIYTETNYRTHTPEKRHALMLMSLVEIVIHPKP